MSTTVIVNHITVVHKGTGGSSMASAPDFCKTPTPAGPTPMPYPNIAEAQDLADGSSTVTADGEPIALKSSAFSKSTGDEAGSAGGVASGVIQGKAKFALYSMDVKVEGQNVARLSDSMTMNGNAPNTFGPELQPLAQAIGSDKVEKLCLIFCWCNEKGNKGGDLFKRVEYDPRMVS